MSLLLMRGSGQIPREFRKDCVLWCDPYLSAKRHQIDVGNLSSALAQSVNTFETGTSESSEVSVYSGKRGEVALDGLTLTNLVQNGDFSSGTDNWTYRFPGTTLSVADNILSITGTGGSVEPDARQKTGVSAVAGDILFLYVRARVTNSDCTSLGLLLHDDDDFITWIETAGGAPTQNTWYELSGAYTLSSDITDITLRIRHQYDNEATANGKIAEVDGTDGVRCINLTEAFGAGNEPTEEWCLANIPYFSNTVSVDPQSVVSKNSDGDIMDTIDLSTIGELRSLPNGTKDSVDKDGTITRNISTGVAITSGTAVNTTNYPLAKDTGDFYIILDADDSKETGTIGTDSASGDGTLYYELDTATTEDKSISLQPLMYDEGQVVLSNANDLPIPSEHKAPIFLQLLENWQNRTQEIQLGSTDGADTNDPYFDGTSLVFEGDDYLTVSDNAVYDKTSAILTLVVERLNTTGDQYLFDKRTGASGPYVKCDAGASTVSNGGGGTVYIDGVATTTLAADGSPHVVQVVGVDIQTDGAGDIKIGCDYNDANFFEGNVYFIDISGNVSTSYSRLVAFLTKLMAKRGITI